MEYFLNFFKDLDMSKKILDVECGDGFFLELLRDLEFQRLSGIDPFDPIVSHARGKGLVVEKGNIYEVDNNENYDVILLMDVLEHLDKPKAGLKKTL